jgi:hypothetical protein
MEYGECLQLGSHVFGLYQFQFGPFQMECGECYRFQQYVSRLHQFQFGPFEVECGERDQLEQNVLWLHQFQFRCFTMGHCQCHPTKGIAKHESRRCGDLAIAGGATRF